MNLPSILAFAVIFVAAPLQWAVLFQLWRRVRRYPEVQTLRERTLVALGLASITTVFALVFLNNGMEVPILDPFATMVLTRAAILALSIPAIWWLWLYRNGGHGA